MSCKICGRGSCTESFHSLEEQTEHDEKFGKYEDKIDELKDRIKLLEKDNETIWNILSSEQRDEIESELES